MPKGVGYNFLDFEKQQIAQEFADMMGLPQTPENIQSILLAVNANPALGANTPTGREIAAQQTDNSTKAEGAAGYVPTDFQPAGAKEALAAYQASLKPTPEDAPLDYMQSIDVSAGRDYEAAPYPEKQQAKVAKKAVPAPAAKMADVEIANTPSTISPTADVTPEGYNAAVASGAQSTAQPSSQQGGQSWYDYIVNAVAAATGGGLLGKYQTMRKAGQQPSYSLKSTAQAAQQAPQPAEPSRIVMPSEGPSPIIMPPERQIFNPIIDNSLGSAQKINQILRAIR